MTIAYSGSNITFPDNSVQATAPKVGMVNRIINGAMVIDQRNAGASVSVTAGTDGYPADRFYIGNRTGSGVFSGQQTTASNPAGYKSILIVTTTTAQASLTSTQWSAVRHSIEGLNVADFGWGTANAVTVTLSFWVRSSLTGTFGGSFVNASFNRSYPFSYSITSANVWQQISITIAGDQSGTWATDNSAGIHIFFGLGVGTTYSGTAGAWAATGYYSATGATSVVGTGSANFLITGVQLEKGSTATSFDYRPYGAELVLCQRYYMQYAANVLRLDFNGAGANYQAAQSFSLPVTMRATPTLNSPSFTYNNANSGQYYTPSADFVKLYAVASGAGNCICTVSSIATASAEL